MSNSEGSPQRATCEKCSDIIAWLERAESCHDKHGADAAFLVLCEVCCGCERCWREPVR
jgi:hypothetical protein